MNSNEFEKRMRISSRPYNERMSAPGEAFSWS